MTRNPLQFLHRLESALRRFIETAAPTLPAPPEARHFQLKLGDVIYDRGWDAPYEVVSGPFNRLYYFRWQGHLVSACADSPATVNYYLKPLGGERFVRLQMKR
ncbi:MAG: hypothetical protein ACLFRN_00565 [Halothece sp.]